MAPTIAGTEDKNAAPLKKLQQTSAMFLWEHGAGYFCPILKAAHPANRPKNRLALRKIIAAKLFNKISKMGR